ncbi:MAG TPA: hypothetical protein VN253_21565 [Kofleriaceae bacterium]|nr:hypothetical protein [Kofleriaceae bacterium]
MAISIVTALAVGTDRVWLVLLQLGCVVALAPERDRVRLLRIFFVVIAHDLCAECIGCAAEKRPGRTPSLVLPGDTAISGESITMSDVWIYL